MEANLKENVSLSEVNFLNSNSSNKLFSFYLPGDFLNNFQSKRQKGLSKGWTSVIKDSFRNVNSDCNISFERNKCFETCSPDGKIWIADAYCLQPNCGKYKFCITKNDTDGSEIRVLAEKIESRDYISALILAENTEVSSSETQPKLSVNKDNNYGYLSFEIPHDFISQYKGSENQFRLKKGWTSVFKTYLSDTNISCDLAFEDNEFLKGQKNNRIWYATAHCKKPECSKYEFSLYSNNIKKNQI